MWRRMLLDGCAMALSTVQFAALPPGARVGKNLAAFDAPPAKDPAEPDERSTSDAATRLGRGAGDVGPGDVEAPKSIHIADAAGAAEAPPRTRREDGVTRSGPRAVFIGGAASASLSTSMRWTSTSSASYMFARLVFLVRPRGGGNSVGFFGGCSRSESSASIWKRLTEPLRRGRRAPTGEGPGCIIAGNSFADAGASGAGGGT
mmetsp:Transcript_121744/g.351511  ORF Transcript_121744/g.351511 Transcript_121744/m.351511 type:complete len:204 (+) Transcript_121744:131-742(+)